MTIKLFSELQKIYDCRQILKFSRPIKLTDAYE